MNYIIPMGKIKNYETKICKKQGMARVEIGTNLQLMLFETKRDRVIRLYRDLSMSVLLEVCIYSRKHARARTHTHTHTHTHKPHLFISTTFVLVSKPHLFISIMARACSSSSY